MDSKRGFTVHHFDYRTKTWLTCNRYSIAPDVHSTGETNPSSNYHIKFKRFASVSWNGWFCISLAQLGQVVNHQTDWLASRWSRRYTKYNRFHLPVLYFHAFVTSFPSFFPSFFLSSFLFSSFFLTSFLPSFLLSPSPFPTSVLVSFARSILRSLFPSFLLFLSFFFLSSLFVVLN